MPKYCAAYNCFNEFIRGSGLSFHRFPLSDKEKLNRWLCALRRKNFTPTPHSVICSEHFTPECFYKNHQRRILKADAVPSIFDYSTHLVQETEPSKEPPHEPSSALENNQNRENVDNQYTDHTYCAENSPGNLKRKCEETLDKEKIKIIIFTKNV